MADAVNWERQAKQFKDELDLVNPKVNVLEAKIAELDTHFRQAVIDGQGLQLTLLEAQSKLQEAAKLQKAAAELQKQFEELKSKYALAVAALQTIKAVRGAEAKAIDEALQGVE